MRLSIKGSLQRVFTTSRMFGFNPLAFMNTTRGLSFYFRDLAELKRQKGDDQSFSLGPTFPVLNERHSNSGTMSGAYFHQDLLVARKVFVRNPTRHIDIGSRVDGFVAHVAAFRNIEIVDIRDQTSKVKNIEFRQADLMQLPADLVGACDSISSLHAIEHFGLGRYGDPIDYQGHLKALSNIAKIVRSGGTFYFSVPIGPQRIEFNAHRVFAIRYLLDALQKDFSLDRFSFVDDKGDLFEDVEVTDAEIDRNYGCFHGCGIFELKKT